MGEKFPSVGIKKVLVEEKEAGAKGWASIQFRQKRTQRHLFFSKFALHRTEGHAEPRLYPKNISALQRGADACAGHQDPLCFDRRGEAKIPRQEGGELLCEDSARGSGKVTPQGRQEGHVAMGADAWQ